jgi:hypothetical protein
MYKNGYTIELMRIYLHSQAGAWERGKKLLVDLEAVGFIYPVGPKIQFGKRE